ncbi:hypothetical protein ABZY31_22360 [Streptomyces sp. NPDC006529]|uniref:hypothetical protein n=1 Tax=Streptomyces sp. NPDC006529 TaxID=3157177 RepID=UPI0033A74FA9
MDNPLLRAPDWDQHADRHTPLVDPVITVRQLGRYGLARTVPTRIDHALVCSTARGTYDAYLPPDRPRRIRRRYTAVYEVDMGVHPVEALIPLPSSDDAHEFDATVQLDWRVTDPVLYVRSGHRHVPRLLLGTLERAARPVARRFPIAESAEAEAEVLSALGHARLGADEGLGVRWTVRIRRDADNIAQARHLQGIEHATAADVLTQQGQLEVQEYEAKRIAFYREYLARGGVDAWALHLARHPDDAKEAMTHLTQDHRDEINAQLQLVKAVLDKGGAEPFELEAIRRLSITAAHGILGQFILGESSPSGPPPSASSAGAPSRANESDAPR